MSKMIVGAQLYTVRQYLQSLPQIAETLAKVKSIGYTAVQVSGLGKEVNPRDVTKLLRDSGLTVAATHFGWNKFRTELDSLIELHRDWGCPHPAIGGLPDEYYSADGVKRFIDELGPIAEKLGKAGMDFSYHNHSHELVRYSGKTWLAMLYDQAPGSLLKAEIDTYWLTAGGGDPAWWVRKCAGRQPLLHVKDMIVLPDRTQRFAEIGEGNLNWQAILAAAADSGVQHLLVEQDQCYDRNQFDSLAISFRNLAAMLAGR